MNSLIVLCCASCMVVLLLSKAECKAKGHLVVISSSAAGAVHARRRLPSSLPVPKRSKRNSELDLKNSTHEWLTKYLLPNDHIRKPEDDLGGSGWLWSSSKSSKKSSSSSNSRHSANRPSAPEPTIKKETSQVQQSSNVKPPAPGWNVPGTNSQNQNSGWKSGYQSPGVPHQQNSHYPTGQQPQGSWSPQTHGVGYPNQHGGYGGYPQQGYNPHYGGGGGYGGYGGMPGHGYGGMGGYGGYGGMGGSGGMGGYGGMGGHGGGWGSGAMGGFGGMGGHDMYKKKSFFSARTIGNVFAGMLLWHATSSLVGSLFGGNSYKRPVNVYNYYNQPETKEEIKLPSNILTLCEGNNTALCTKGTTAICTTNNTVLCVTTMSQAAPCAEEKALCVNTSIPCMDPNNPLCQNITTETKEANVNLPCFTNLTVDVNLLNETGHAQNTDYKYCVTTMAVAGPEYKDCTDMDAVSDWKSPLEGNYTWNLTVLPHRRPYTIYNFKHPTEAAAGEIILPTEILTPCVENATKLCLPGLTPVCTTFNEIMCLEVLSATKYCETYNTTCTRLKIPCRNDMPVDPICEGSYALLEGSEGSFAIIDFPCFANITVNTNSPKFDIHSFNGTFPAGSGSSFMYHYHYCVVTLGIPGPESDICVTGSPPASKSS